MSIGAVLFVLLPLFLIIYFDKSRYEKSTYKQETNYSYFKVRLNTGLYGEYLTVRVLDNLKDFHRVLVNIYLPNGKGGTTELDVVLIHKSGVYSLESKNYSGWIFGKEKDYKWCQVLPGGKKTFFYNPIKQNRTHIKALQRVLPNIHEAVFKSTIVFSERCELKKITVHSSDIRVIKRSRLLHSIHSNPQQVLSASQIDSIYVALKEYTQVTNQTKQIHVEHIKKKFKS